MNTSSQYKDPLSEARTFSRRGPVQKRLGAEHVFAAKAEKHLTALFEDLALTTTTSTLKPVRSANGFSTGSWAGKDFRISTSILPLLDCACKLSPAGGRQNVKKASAKWTPSKYWAPSKSRMVKSEKGRR